VGVFRRVPLDGRLQKSATAANAEHGKIELRRATAEKIPATRKMSSRVGTISPVVTAFAGAHAKSAAIGNPDDRSKLRVASRAKPNESS